MSELKVGDTVWSIVSCEEVNFKVLKGRVRSESRINGLFWVFFQCDSCGGNSHERRISGVTTNIFSTRLAGEFAQQEQLLDYIKSHLANRSEDMSPEMVYEAELHGFELDIQGQDITLKRK